MSVIRVDNFGPSAGGTTYSARGIAKAWINFNGTGTIAARDSENVSSLTDNGTGEYTANFNNAFDVANYALYGTCSGDASSFAWVSSRIGNTKTVSAYHIVTIRDSVGNLLDPTFVNIAAHGDLA